MKEEEMLEIADLINDALQNRDDANALEGIHGKVKELTRRFPLPS
jgi:glycine hydroxymethyltransferase